jgi:Mg-chelatase subunit ChlD
MPWSTGTSRVLQLSGGRPLAPPAPPPVSAPVSSAQIRLAEQLAAAERRAAISERRIDAAAAELDAMKRRRAEAEVRGRLDALRDSGRIEASEHEQLSRPEHVAALAATPTLLAAAEARPMRMHRIAFDEAAAGKVSERAGAIFADAAASGQRVSRMQAARQATHELLAAS